MAVKEAVTFQSQAQPPSSNPQCLSPRIAAGGRSQPPAPHLGHRNSSMTYVLSVLEVKSQRAQVRWQNYLVHVAVEHRCCPLDQSYPRVAILEQRFKKYQYKNEAYLLSDRSSLWTYRTIKTDETKHSQRSPVLVLRAAKTLFSVARSTFLDDCTCVSKWEKRTLPTYCCLLWNTTQRGSLKVNLISTFLARLMNVTTQIAITADVVIK